MAPILATTGLPAPRCLACWQRLSGAVGFGLDEGAGRGLFALQMQVRGNKKSKKAALAATMAVKLNRDLKEFGRKGTIVPVSVGQMRNRLFPKGIASYLNAADASAVKEGTIRPFRDNLFGVKTHGVGGAELIETASSEIEQPARDARLPDTVRAELRPLEPEDAFELLSGIIPPTINFYRATIENPDANPLNREAEAEADSGPGAAAAAGAGAAASAPIYGSVSSSDIVNSIRSLVDSTHIKGRIALAERDVQFLDSSEADESGDRVKRLGDFEFAVKIKGVLQPIRRIARVLAEGERPLDSSGVRSGHGDADPAPAPVELEVDTGSALPIRTGDAALLDHSGSGSGGSTAPARQ